MRLVAGLWIVRLGFEWIPEEHEHIDEPVGDATTQLLIPAERTAPKSLDVETGVFGDESTRRAGADEGVLGEFRAVVGGPCE